MGRCGGIYIVGIGWEVGSGGGVGAGWGWGGRVAWIIIILQGGQGDCVLHTFSNTYTDTAYDTVSAVRCSWGGGCIGSGDSGFEDIYNI